MKKHIVILAVSLLLAVPSFAQNKLAMGIDQHIGIGLGGASPVVFGNTSFVIQYTFAKYFQVGAGAGLRCGVPTRSYDLVTKSKQRAFELDVPIFLRAGVKFSIVSVKVDVGYALGLKAWAFNFKEGVTRDLHYNGFFVEPHIDLGGDHLYGNPDGYQQQREQDPAGHYAAVQPLLLIGPKNNEALRDGALFLMRKKVYLYKLIQNTYGYV